MFGKYNGFVSKARVSACMYFLVSYNNLSLLSGRKTYILNCGGGGQKGVLGHPPSSLYVKKGPAFQASSRFFEKGHLTSPMPKDFSSV